MQIASMDHWLGKAYHKKNTEQYEHDRKEGKNAALKKLSGTQVFGRENVMRFFVVVEGKATCVCVCFVVPPGLKLLVKDQDALPWEAIDS